MSPNVKTKRKTRSKGTPRNNKAVADRKKKLRVLIRQGVIVADMPELIGVDIRTIKRYLKELYEEMREELGNTEYDKILMEFMERHEKRAGELEKIYNQALDADYPDLKTANAIAKTMKENDAQKIEILCKLGIKKQAIQEVDQTVNIRWLKDGEDAKDL